MRKIIINALIQEEVRIAILEGNRLQNVYFDVSILQVRRHNVYKGHIIHYESSLEALFVDFGGGRDGFLPTSNLGSNCLPSKFFDENNKLLPDADYSGQELLVQVERHERENKGATLTTEITLSGSYTLIVFGRKAGHVVSRTIAPPKRTELLDIVGALKLPENCQVIIRNAGRNCSAEQIQQDIQQVINIYDSICSYAESVQAPEFIFQDSSLISKTLRESCRDTIDEIVVDSQEYFEICANFLNICFPQHIDKLHLHSQPESIFHHYEIEDQIKHIYKRNVRLPSGGEIVIDYTEALTAIDINSSQSTSRGNIEDTALDTNLEAVEEVARQIRLRDIGGLIVIDVIDMKDNKAKQKVTERLQQAVQADASYIRIGEISTFHLLEMTRERIMPSIRDTSFESCHQCQGTGWIKNLTASVTMSLREIRTQASKEKTRLLIVRAHYDLASYILNNKRKFLDRTEQITDCEIVVLPDINLSAHQYTIENSNAEGGNYDRLRNKAKTKNKIKYTPPESIKLSRYSREDFISPSEAKGRKRSGGKKPGLFKRIFQALFGSGGKPNKPKHQTRGSNQPRRSGGQGSRNRSRNRNRYRQNRQGGQGGQGGQGSSGGSGNNSGGGSGGSSSGSSSGSNQSQKK